MSRRVAVVAVLLTGLARPCFGQQSETIAEYLRGSGYEELLKKPDRTLGEISGLLPQSRTPAFAEFIRTRFSREFTLAALRGAVENLRLNKLVGNTPTGTGTTALLSKVAVPGAFGFASEVGAITQSTNGTTTTLRANLLGLVNLVAGNEQFPTCPDVTLADCAPTSRWLRRFSVSTSFDSLGASSGGTEEAAPSASTDFFGGNFRLSSWTARVDLTANDPDDARYLERWKAAVPKLRTTEALKFTASIDALIGPGGKISDAYAQWRAEAFSALQKLPAGAFEAELERQLEVLVGRMVAADPEFWNKVVAVRRTTDEFFAVRNEVLKAIQSHQASLEYVDNKPVDQPELSTVRFIYSHQPSARSAVLVTANVAARWYTHELEVVDDTGAPVPDQGRFRDIQVAGQIDRRLGPGMGESVFSLGAYYQWMADDALLKFDPEDGTAPGSGIELTDTAIKVLDSKGHIGVVQVKLTVPIRGAMKVPLSLTWANRKELVTELEKKSVFKAQIGFTLDFDSLLKGKS
jgi:hypothetical protein